MKPLCALTLLACLLFASTARASDEHAIALDQVPQLALDLLRAEFPGAELLSATKIVENGKECFVVTIRDRERVLSYYLRPDGTGIAMKEDVYAFRGFTGLLLEGGLFFLLPGVIAGVLTRWLAQVGRSSQRSVGAEWFAAWIGAVFIIWVLLSALNTFREKDWLIIALMCAVWGAASASMVQVLGLIVQSIRGSRTSCCRAILGCVCAAIAFLSLTLPVDMLWRHRSNQHHLGLALRAPGD